MKVNSKWYRTQPGTRELVANRIVLARVWKAGNSHQIAVNLPLTKNPETHLYGSEREAMGACEKSVEIWFNQIDA